MTPSVDPSPRHQDPPKGPRSSPGALTPEAKRERERVLRLDRRLESDQLDIECDALMEGWTNDGDDSTSPGATACL